MAMMSAIATSRDAKRHAGQRQERRREDREEHHVLPRDGEDVRETRAAEVVADVLRDAVVLAEDEAAEKRCCDRRGAALERRLGAAADVVERAAKAAARRAGRLDAVGREHERGAGALDLRALPGRRLTHGAGHDDLGALVDLIESRKAALSAGIPAFGEDGRRGSRLRSGPRGCRARSGSHRPRCAGA